MRSSGLFQSVIVAAQTIRLNDGRRRFGRRNGFGRGGTDQRQEGQCQQHHVRRNER